jgi:hypothetical protein
MNTPILRLLSRRPLVALCPLSLLIALASTARGAEPEGPVSDASPLRPPEPKGEGACAFAASDSFERGVALEVNVLWPFLPGIFEARIMVPLWRTSDRDWRGELVTGAYADNASWFVRGDESGKVRNLSGKLGYRQFFVYGLHAEVSANIGWRHESDRPASNGTVYPPNIDGAQARLWVLAGYQYELSRSLYVNARGGVSLNLYRSDAYAYLEKSVVPGGDINVGVRF